MLVIPTVSSQSPPLSRVGIHFGSKPNFTVTKPIISLRANLNKITTLNPSVIENSRGRRTVAIVGRMIAGIVNNAADIVLLGLRQRRRHRRQDAQPNTTQLSADKQEWSAVLDSVMERAAKQSLLIKGLRGSPDHHGTGANKIDVEYLTDTISPTSTDSINRVWGDETTTDEFIDGTMEGSEDDVSLASSEGLWEHPDLLGLKKPIIDIEKMDPVERERRQEEVLERMRQVLRQEY